ncbi:MAG: hypothetical protein GC168_04155 [Candidatus Hydrogenedens sp.]|nr:hypothetical protein [Candidatus Hydrogenedens sp.]
MNAISTLTASLILVCHAAAAPPDSVYIDLGAVNDERGLWLVRDNDGWNEAVVQDGVDCRQNDLSPHGRTTGTYLYFRVSNEWAYHGSRPEVWLRVEYFDGPAGQPLYLDYDATGDGIPARYKRPEPLLMAGTGTWREHVFHLEDAYFGDRQNKGCDFRFSCGEGLAFQINRVWVSETEAASNIVPAAHALELPAGVVPASALFGRGDATWPLLRGYSPHHYGIVSDLAYDYRPVLDRLAGRGINLVRAMPLNAYDVQPFLRDSDGRYDLMRIDPAYLERIREFTAYANARGLAVQFSVLDHCSLRHGTVKDRFAYAEGNNTQGIAITDTNFASFWNQPDGSEMQAYRAWIEALVGATRGQKVIFEVMNEPYVDSPDVLPFHRVMLEMLREAGAGKVSFNAWNDADAKTLEPLADYIGWHGNGFEAHDGFPPEKVLISTDTGAWHSKADVIEWAAASFHHGYNFEHMAMSDDGDTGEADTDWEFIRILGLLASVPDD